MATDPKLITVHPLGNRAPSPGNAPFVLWLPASVLFLSVFLLYLGTRTHYNTFDAVSYANQIERLYPATGDRHWLFHPHHLLFNVTCFLLWHAAGMVGYPGSALHFIQDLNALMGAVGITVFYLTLRRLMQRSRWLPFLVSLGLALSFGYWICATDARVNMPSTVFLISAFSLLCVLMEGPKRPLAAGVGALAGIAVLFHESSGIFFVVGLVGILLTKTDELMLREAARRTRIHLAATYFGTWLGVIAIPYFLVGVFGLHLHSLSAFRHWMTTYSELGWWWSFDILHNLRLDAYALRHAAFVEPPGKQGTFHLSPHVPQALSALYFATLLGWFVAVYAFAAALPLLWRTHHARVMMVSLLWIVLYAAFFTVWSPGYFVFWVPVLVPISLLLALALAHYRARRGGVLVNWLVGAWIVLFATVNLVTSINPHRQGYDPYQRIGLDIHSHTQPGDLMIVAGAGDDGQSEVDIPYFGDRECVSLHTLLTRSHENEPLALATAQSQIDAALGANHAVYALNEVRGDPRTFGALQKRHPTLNKRDWNSVLQKYTLKPAWKGPHGIVWRLFPIRTVKTDGPPA